MFGLLARTQTEVAYVVVAVVDFTVFTLSFRTVVALLVPAFAS